LALGVLRGDGEARHCLRFLAKVGPALLRAKGPRILFERHSGLGDVVCSFPAVAALRQRHPDALIVVAVKAEFASAVECANVADVVAPMHHGVWTNPGWLDQLFDIVHRPLNADEKKVGANTLHLVDGLCAAVGVQPVCRQPRIQIPARLSTRMQARLREAGLAGQPIVAVHTGPSWGVKEWTQEGWDQLGSWLTRERQLRVIQVGADVHFGMGSTRAARLPGATDWVGRITLEETLACIAACDLFVGIDSGLLHVAGAVGTPAVGVFGPTSASLISPPETPNEAATADVPCLGCHHRSPILHWRNSCPNQIACMGSLPASRVIAACARLLDARNPEAVPRARD
jgi:hypothetical protein